MYSLLVIIVMMSMGLGAMFVGRYGEAIGFMILPTLILAVDVIGWFSWNHFIALMLFFIAIVLIALLDFDKYCEEMKENYYVCWFEGQEERERQIRKEEFDDYKRKGFIVIQNRIFIK